MDLEPNAQRFSGFAGLYDRVRPSPPAAAAELLRAYAGSPRPAVVDLGSGTGLSSRWCAGWARRVIGVEPSEDMREQAATIGLANVEALPGWSHATGLPAGCADVVVAVQALHWMDPEPTLAEVARILRPGGVFAALDCDWPPAVGNARAETAWDRCMAAAVALEDRVPSGARAWSKDGHLARMRASGHFAFCRELAFHTTEPGDAARFVDLLRSQGGIQSLRKHGVDDAAIGVSVFADQVRAALGDGPCEITFVYRMRVGVLAPATG